LTCNITSQSFGLTNATPIHIRGEVGGNVTFHCPDEKKEDVQFFYFQTNDTFVNGYYDSKDLRTYGPIWENTRVDHNEKTVDMYRLNISHSRVYECIIQYKDGSLSTKSISLSVTANYSKPTVTKSCEDGSSCLVTCVSYGGYPGTEVMWNIPVSENTSGQLWKVVNNSEVPNPSTMMYNSFSTAYFNCSKGELTYLSCSVGDVTSDMFSVCKPKVVHGIYNPVIITAICAVVAFVISIVALLLWRKYKKRPTGKDRDYIGHKVAVLHTFMFVRAKRYQCNNVQKLTIASTVFWFPGALAVDVKHGQSVKE
uniref:Ig-like domain-containing protein n=1 Tax=Seriola lalandi dorsalis TaxID=1841481 RepID=A0A3B4YGJ2_SERLL